MKGAIKAAATSEVLYHRENYLVRRQRLAPGEATFWHRDPSIAWLWFWAGIFWRLNSEMGPRLKTGTLTPEKSIGPNRASAFTELWTLEKKLSKRLWHSSWIVTVPQPEDQP